MNGAKCVDGRCGEAACKVQYRCDCQDGWSGDHCEYELDECGSYPCENGSTCVDGIYSYACICAAGYVGFNCEVDYNECDSSPCFNGATCIDSNTHKDNSQSGVGVGGSMTLDVSSEYALSLANNVKGAYNDQEVTGDELLADKEGSALLKALQLQLAQEYGVDPSQITVQGITPEVIPTSGGSRRLQNAFKINYLASISQPVVADKYKCFCAGGYAGYLCDHEVDECASKPCLHGATCTHGTDTYACTCTAGYSDVPTGTCYTEMDECASAPCLNKARCFDHIDSYTCVCSDGYSGYNCEINVDECASSPCMNGGTCIDMKDKYICDPSQAMLALTATRRSTHVRRQRTTVTSCAPSASTWAQVRTSVCARPATRPRTAARTARTLRSVCPTHARTVAAALTVGARPTHATYNTRARVVMAGRARRAMSTSTSVHPIHV